MARRYGKDVQSIRVGLQASTIGSLEALVPAGERSAFVDAAVRAALRHRARIYLSSASPGDDLSAIADVLRDLAAELDAHAKAWGPAGPSPPPRR